jgi:hypothetical protein
MKKVFTAVLVLVMFTSISYSASFAESVLPSSIPNPDEGKFGPENAPIFYIIKTKLKDQRRLCSKLVMNPLLCLIN